MISHLSWAPAFFSVHLQYISLLIIQAGSQVVTRGEQAWIKEMAPWEVGITGATFDGKRASNWPTQWFHHWASNGASTVVTFPFDEVS